MLCRIFTSPQTFPTGLRWISPESQLVITSLMVAMQLMTSLVWIIVQPPGQSKSFSGYFPCQTSSDRPKYLRLKNSKLTSKCQSIGELGTFYEKKTEKKFHKAEKTKEGPFGLVRYCMLCGKLFWFSSLGQQVQFGVFSKFCRTFGRTILVTSGGLKKITDEKP